MLKVFLFSFLMVLGIIFSQWFDLSTYRPKMMFCVMVLLSYIMMEVGLEFDLEKKRLKSYGKDYLIAMTAAFFPWLFCSIYFFFAFKVNLLDALIVGRFAAPTSAGVLFTMLAAAGLASTWVFKKVRVLAILDDLDTIIFIIPLQMIYIGWDIRSTLLLFIILMLLVVAYRCAHRIKLPTSSYHLLLYSVVLVALIKRFEKSTLLQLEILFPSFIFGCLLFRSPHEKTATLLDQAKPFDTGLKWLYMFLVGCSLPKMGWENIGVSFLVFHLCMLLFLSNMGKLYPLFCYKKEASFRERLGLSIAMWPRGEVGAGILLLSMKESVPPLMVSLAGLSIVVNLTLTALFIFLVVWLIRPQMLERS